MRNQIKSRGFGLIGLIISIGIILVLVFGVRYFNGTSQPNQIEEGQRAIDQAKDAANQENQDSVELQNQLNGSADVNYHGIQNNLKNIQQ